MNNDWILQKQTCILTRKIHRATSWKSLAGQSNMIVFVERNLVFVENVTVDYQSHIARSISQLYHRIPFSPTLITYLFVHNYHQPRPHNTNAGALALCSHFLFKYTRNNRTNSAWIDQRLFLIWRSQSLLLSAGSRPDAFTGNKKKIGRLLIWFRNEDF